MKNQKNIGYEVQKKQLCSITRNKQTNIVLEVIKRGYVYMQRDVELKKNISDKEL